jgi:hypothetical protein
MTFTFNPREMADDLVALSRVGATFLAPHSVARIERLAKDLLSAVANAVETDTPEFKWQMLAAEPIEIATSRWWKGAAANFAPLTATVTVDYTCVLRPAEGRLLAKKGVTTIRILGLAEPKGFHFDVEEGGWTEINNGVQQGRAGHPHLHVQFYGALNDIPRLPTLTVHPVDVISLAILELHQQRWRDHLISTQAKSKLRHIPSRQRSRIDTTLSGWRQKINNPDYLPIIGMQSICRAPLAF